MDFKHPDGRTVAVVLPERSLLVMKGESRYLWTHGWETGSFFCTYTVDIKSLHTTVKMPGFYDVKK